MPCGIWISHIFPSQESPLFRKSATRYKGLMQSPPKPPLSSTLLCPLACFSESVDTLWNAVIQSVQVKFNTHSPCLDMQEHRNNHRGPRFQECHIRTANVPPKVPLFLWDDTSHVTCHQCVHWRLYSLSIEPYIMSCCTPYDISSFIEQVNRITYITLHP